MSICQGLKGDTAMKDSFIVLGRALALVLTYGLLLTLLSVLAEDAHAPAIMASAPSAVVFH